MWTALLAIALAIGASQIGGAGPQEAASPVASGARVIPIWPEGVPGAKADGGEERRLNGRVFGVQTPALTYMPADPSRASGAAVIVCPGGWYERLAIDREGFEVGRRLSAMGLAVFVLKHRVKEYGHPAPLQDVLRAIRHVRAHAGDLGVHPDRIGVVGASAGGHLAATAATLFDAPEGRTGAPLDATSARPDFAALLYPVITLRPPFGHAASRRNLIGDTPPDDLVDRLSLELQVTKGTPPVFLVHSGADTSVPIENSLMFYRALREAGVPVEAHFFETGPHGFAVNPGLRPASDWPSRFEAWLRLHGWLPPAPAAAGEPGTVVWTLDRLDRVGGHAVTVLGAPRVVETDIGPAVEFDGARDGLQLDVNPIAGLERFTIEVLFQPASGGPEEQRFLHVEEATTGNRALLETRMLPGDAWCLDTFLRYGDASLPLIDRGAAHSTGRWHVVALTFDGKTMAHYVDGAREAAGEVAFRPLGPGRTSIGVRLNRVSWFKGRIRQVRFTPRAR